MLKKFFKKSFTNNNFMQELLFQTPRYEWLTEALSNELVDINHQNENNDTPLMVTLQKDHDKSALWLIDNDADPTIRNKNNQNAIDIAIHKNKIKIVEELLKMNKLDIDQKDEYGRSLLQNIIISGNHKMAKILIKCGANINTLDGKGKHILYDALSYGDPVFVRDLLKYKNIELNDIDKDGNTLMQHPQIEQNDTLAKDLLIAGCDPTKLNAKGESYLYKTALRGKEAEDIIDIALTHGANINEKTTSGRTIMMQIVFIASKVPPAKKQYRLDLLNIVHKMLKYNGDINALDQKGESGLFNAVALRDTELIDFLLDAKIDTNIQNTRGQTVLENLVYDGMEYSKIIEQLLNHTIKPTLKNKDGQTIYEILTNLILHKHGTLPLSDESLVKMYDPDALYFDVVKLLLSYEKEEEGKEFILDFFDSEGNPLFFKPLMYDNFALFSLYTRYNINLHQINKQQHNIFFAYVLKIFENNITTATVCKNFQNNISSLISRKVEKNFKDSLGWTILHKILSTKCNIKLFKILTDVVRFDYTIADNLGRTVIHNAVWQDNVEVVKIINAKAHESINLEDNYGITPIYYAALLGNKNLVSQFFDLGAAITTKGNINLKAVKKFKPMLKNLVKLKIDLDDLALEKRMDSIISEIEHKFGV